MLCNWVIHMLFAGYVPISLLKPGLHIDVNGGDDDACIGDVS